MLGRKCLSNICEIPGHMPECTNDVLIVFVKIAPAPTGQRAMFTPRYSKADQVMIDKPGQGEALILCMAQRRRIKPTDAICIMQFKSERRAVVSLP